MGGGGGGSAPDTSAQEAQASQQAGAQQQLMQQQAAQNQQLADQQQAQRTEDLQRMEEDRNRQAQAAAARANEVATYTAGRQQRSKDVQGGINSAFSSFNDDYYNKYTADYSGYYTPQVNKQYDDARKELAFGLARGGNLDSSAAADKYGRLSEDYNTELGTISNNATGAAAALRSNVNSAKSGLMQQGLSASTIGSDVAPEGIGNVNTSLAGMDTNIANVRSLANSTSAGLAAPPNYSPLGQLFGSALSGVATGASGYNTGLAFNAMTGQQNSSTVTSTNPNASSATVKQK